MISVITPSIGRPTLAAAIESVNAQTLPPVEHLIGIDHARIGPARMRNELVAASQGEWLAFLDDDDALLPNHLEALFAASSDADLVWSLCDGFRHICNPRRLEYGNHIPVTVLLRREAFDRAYGFPDSQGEDCLLWRRLLAQGARFRCVHETTWVHRP